MKLVKFPKRVTVELTNSCNLLCRFCPSNYLKKVPWGFMEEALFKRVIDEVAGEKNVTVVPFFRGEPLLHPKFNELMDYVKLKKIKSVQIATNATLLNDEVSKKILDSSISFISFSLDAPDKKTYEALRINSDYEDVINNVESFINSRNSLRKKLPIIQVSAVKTAENKNLVKNFIDRWIGLVDRVRIYKEHSQGGKFGVIKGEKNKVGKRKPCKKLFEDIVIYWDGKVAICNHDWNRVKFLGDASKDSIRDIWDSDLYRKEREKQLTLLFDKDDICKSCSHWESFYTKKGLIGEVYSKKDSKK